MAKRPPKLPGSTPPPLPPRSPKDSGAAQSADLSPRSADTRRSGMGAVVLHHSVTALMLMLILALGVWSYLSFRKTSFFQAPVAADASRIEDFVEIAQIQRIRFALRVFYRLDGRYPLTLDELVERNLLLPSDLSYPSTSADETQHFSYERTAKAYTLDLARPTRTPTTMPPLL